MNLPRRAFLWSGATTAAALAMIRLGADARASHDAVAVHADWMLTDAQWRERLSPEAYAVLRQEGTERPHSSPLNAEAREGSYNCGGCGLPVFASATKFDAGTGWPSFWRAIDANVVETEDRSLGMTRTAVYCRRCVGHLGHVFADGPNPTGLRYCINGVALAFEAA